MDVVYIFLIILVIIASMIVGAAIYKRQKTSSWKEAFLAVSNDAVAMV